MADRKALVLASGATQEIGSADNLDVNNAKVVNVEDPTAAQDGTNKRYTDAFIVPRTWLHAPWVRLATTGPGTLASSFENGDTLDGGVLATGDVILLKDQANPAENGIYTVAASGAPTRHTSLDSAAEFVPGGFVRVGEGNTNGDTTWVLTVVPPVTIGTTPITWAKATLGNLAAIKGAKATTGIHALIEAHTDDDDPARVLLYVVGAAADADRYAALVGIGGGVTRLRLQPLGGTVESGLLTIEQTASPHGLLVKSSTAARGRIRVEDTATGGVNVPGYMIYNEGAFKGGWFYDEQADRMELWHASGRALIYTPTTIEAQVEPTVDKSVATKLYVDNKAFKGASTGDTDTGGSTSSVNLHSVTVPGDAIDPGSVYVFRGLAEVTSTAGGGRRILACQYGGGDFLVLDTDAGDALAANGLLCYFKVEVHVISTGQWYYSAEWWDSSWPNSIAPAKKQAAVATNLANGTTFRIRAHTLNGSDNIRGKALSIGRVA